MKYVRSRAARAELTAAVLAIAVLLRLASTVGARTLAASAASDPDVIAALLQAELGDAVQRADAAEEASETVRLTDKYSEDPPPDEPAETGTDPGPEPEPEPEATDEPAAAEIYTQADAENVVIAGASGYDPDVSELLLNHPLRLDLSRDGPKVLIIHTHASEAYTPSPGWEYEPSDTLRTEDTARSVVRVGDAIAEALESRGIGVVHDREIRDYPSYNGSYTRTLAAIEEYLAEYPSICCVLDVHRDAADDGAGGAAAFSCTVGGEKSAQLMLVVGTDAGGLPHPNWQENLALAVRVQARLTRTDPSLCRPIDLRTERFNQHATAGSLLVEVGASGNTMPEALAAAGYFAEALADALEGG